MADKSEWITPSMESEGKGDGHQYGQKPRTPDVTRANPNSWETHPVRKRWDIGLLRALSLRIMMMMMMMIMMVTSRLPCCNIMILHSCFSIFVIAIVLHAAVCQLAK